MVKYNPRLCNLVLSLGIACYIWGNGQGKFYAVGTEAPKGTKFYVYVNGAYRTWFQKLNTRYYVGATNTGDIITVEVDGAEVCVGG